MKKQKAKIIIIDYGAGNIQSILYALKRVGYEGKLSNKASEIISADKVIFPGVGEAGSAMRHLKEFGLDSIIPELTQPVLGICLGMQLMCEFSQEGNTKGLGIFKTVVKKFDDQQKVPHIGWNKISNFNSPVFSGIKNGEYVYLVHSFYAPLCEETIAVTHYGTSYSSALQKNNFYGFQFHPEKSSTAGEILLRNFLSL